ncbi:NACHT, LRR and PYD domains-containing protein 14-like isoform X2 [Ciona intestinalis]
MYTPEGSILIEKLFDVAKQVAQEEADKKCNTPEAKAMHVVKYGNIVCAVGLPGVGKSTLLKMMINCIVVDKSVKPDTQFLFHVSLKKFNPNKKVTLLEFLLYGNLSEWNHSDEENKALVHFLYNNPNVVISIDGWDELYTKQANKRLHECQLDSKQIPEVFVKNLLMGNLLPNAVKFITSRPGQFYELHPDYRQGLVSEVRGMDKPAKKDLTKQICGEANLETVEKYLADRPNLDALCSIPVNCIQIVACLHSSVSSGREINSMTDVFIHTLTNYKASDHVRTNMSEREIGQELVKLAHLAYKGLSERKLVFKQADFEEVGINKQTVDIFLHTYVEKSHHLKMRILEGKKRSYFTHLTSHEFYAALHLMLFMSQEEFRRCMDTFEDPHWEVVTRFLFGICNSTSYEDLKVIFPALMIKDYKEKKNILKSLITHQDQQYSKYVIRSSGWVHEANDAEISQRFQECMPQLIKMDAPTYPTEASDVAFAFNTFTTLHDLDLNLESLDESSAETLLRGLHGSQAKIERLNIFSGRMTDSTTQALLPHLDVMDKLGLESGSNYMNLNPYMEDISRKIMDRQNKIQLDISAPLDENATHWLARCLSNVSDLTIREEKLSAQNLIILHEAVERLTNPQGLTVNDINGDRWPKYWGLYKDQPDDDVMQILQFPLGKIKRLNIYDVRMTDSTTQALLPHLDVMDKLGLESWSNDMNLNPYMEDISRKIMDRQNKIQIWMDGPAVEHVRPLFQCLDKISKLCLDMKRLSSENNRLLEEAIQRLHSPQDFVLEEIPDQFKDHIKYLFQYTKFWNQYLDY